MPAVTHVVNHSISSNKFPEYWKAAKIIPLHKKEDLLEPKNYRPIAILPIFSKVLERAIFNQIFKYLSLNNLLHPNHHAYRPGHNTTSALIQMYDSWIGAVDDKELTAACLLHMSAAFDIVDHPLLLQKLEVYGFDRASLELITSYLRNKRQCVSFSCSLSRLLPVTTGIPQGSILGLCLLMSCLKLFMITQAHQNPSPASTPAARTVAMWSVMLMTQLCLAQTKTQRS